MLDLHHERDRGRELVPLAAICKRLEVRMSVLQRHFTLLETLHIAQATCDEAGRWTAKLLPMGILSDLESKNEWEMAEISELDKAKAA